MCGIAGIFRVGSASTNSDMATLLNLTEKMSASLAHRGPDGSGIWRHTKWPIAMAHRRLAVIDLTADASQPMRDLNTGNCVVFNGEIYNYKELVRELQRDGQVVPGSGDTVTLLCALSHWGVERALQRLVGMFAFAFWHESSATLHLARDRMGEKPLFITQKNDLVAFASEVRAFQRVGEFGCSVNRHATSAYLNRGYVATDASLLDGVIRIPPASYLSISLGADSKLSYGERGWYCKDAKNYSNPRKYWDLSSIAASNAAAPMRDMQQSKEEFEYIFDEAVRLQLRADVPMGAFLSGGVDSSLIVAAMMRSSSGPAESFTVKFDDARFDESSHARRIADYFGTRHNELHLGANSIADAVPEISAVMDEPTANGSYFASTLISRLARKRVVVALSGEGADELFGGYNRYRHLLAWWSRVGGINARTRSAIAGAASGALRLGCSDILHTLDALRKEGGQTSLETGVEKVIGILKSATFLDAYSSLTACHEYGLAGESLRFPAESQSLFAGKLSLLQQMLLIDQCVYLPGDALTKLDRASMSAGLETRLPFLDHRLVEFSWRLSDEHKIGGSHTKRILKASLADLAPKELYDRKKMGFTAPIASWLQGPLKDWAYDNLKSCTVQTNLDLEKTNISKLLRDFERGNTHLASRIWALVLLCVWSQQAFRVPRGH